ncbi:MAG: tetratricopeptide repeat protein [Bryobacterales bacterium]|nr:tetratricopeptide repeat protein [Bryobacterales bacterium]
MLYMESLTNVLLEVLQDMFAQMMSRKLIAIAPLFLFAVAGLAQTSNIQGDVKGTDGKPLQGAQVKLDRTDIKQSFNVKTDKNGHFLYANLPTGVYTITVQVGGKDVAQITGMRSRQGDNPPLVFDLAEQAKAAAAAAAAGPAAGPAPGQGQGKEDAGMTKEQRAEYEKKLKEQEAAMAKDKALQDAFNAGMEAKNAKNFPVAVENFEKASTMSPTQHVVWAQLAESYISLGDTKNGAEKDANFEKGIAAYAKAVEIKVDDANYHNNYALALAKGKKMEQAQAELTKAAQLDPPQAGKYYYNLGAVYVNTGQNEAAEGAFKKAIELDPTYADAFYQYALVLMNKVSLDKDGKMVAPPGTTDALQKYLSLRPDGQNAEGAKAILEQLGTTVQTTFERPGSKGKQPANPKKSK